ncbi:MAG: 1-acyl-sn-glycerol-3-phosphate acyltransferase [Lachnospiraceae bacterium]|nr:1-acyl-sn-glycerol-3-phosphate acyltransferase [Lachnospiraceae bacterium]
MLRTAAAVLFVVIYLIVSLPLMLVLYLVGRVKPKTAELIMLRIVQRAFRVVTAIAGTDVTVLGAEKIPGDEPVLYVGNHQSFFDIVIGYSRVPGITGFVAKDNLKKVPLLNLNMMFLHCLFLDREDIRQGLETIKTAISYVKDDARSIFIFPEGTRNKGPELPLMDFHRGSFKIAQRTGCRIVPVSFNNTAEILERHFPKLRRAKVVVEFGDPVLYRDLTREEQKQIDVYFCGVLTEMVRKNQELI